MRDQVTPMLFLDFDGTISRADVVDALLERFAVPEWRRLEEEWRAGRIGSRECLAGQIACVRATPDALDAAIDAIALDAGLTALLDTAARLEMPIHILSDGFDYCIHRLLNTLAPHVGASLKAAVRASHLEPAGGEKWRAAFPFFPDGCEHGCATCKPGLMRDLSAGTRPTIFVGDGLSDRYAARAADVVFAKHALAEYCQREGIPYTAYADLGAIAAAIDRGARADDGRPPRVVRVAL